MKNLVLNNPLNGEFKPVKDDDGTTSGLSLAQGKVKIDDLEVRNLSGSINCSGDFSITVQDDLEIHADAYITMDVARVAFVTDGTSKFLFDGPNTRIRIIDDTDVADHFTIQVAANGVTGLLTNDNDGTAGHLELIPDGDLILDPASSKIIINTTDDLFFDGGGDTYITESTSDNLQFVVGGDQILNMSENGTSGNHAHFKASSAGFTTVV